MPEVNQFIFSNKELLAMLIQAADVREGRWMLMANFGITAGYIGPTPEQVGPGVAVHIGHVGITRAQEDTPETASLDAAEVNPRSRKKGTKSD
jgi:hypothetical protein